MNHRLLSCSSPARNDSPFYGSIDLRYLTVCCDKGPFVHENSTCHQITFLLFDGTKYPPMQDAQKAACDTCFDVWMRNVEEFLTTHFQLEYCTSKSQTLSVCGKAVSRKLGPFVVDGNTLPWIKLLFKTEEMVQAFEKNGVIFDNVQAEACMHSGPYTFRFGTHTVLRDSVTKHDTTTHRVRVDMKYSLRHDTPVARLKSKRSLDEFLKQAVVVTA